MSTTSTVNNTSSSSASSIYSQLSGTSGSTATQTAADTSDRFLKLLVAQMKNQDPLSPMDNAQVTSQMAQINTVSGIEKLNTSVTSLGSQLMQSQTLQGASLVGKGVLVEGNKLNLENGSAMGAFDLSGAADGVKVEVLSSAGRVVDTIDLGAETSGTHSFEWTPPASAANSTGLTFRVAATKGSTTVASTALMRDQVQSISTSGSSLNLNLASGSTVAYSAVKAISE
jgi:flagellar basal-body rod modification protein FlgD